MSTTTPPSDLRCTGTALNGGRCHERRAEGSMFCARLGSVQPIVAADPHPLQIEMEELAARKREEERSAERKRKEAEARAAQCRATTKAGVRCRNRAPHGARFCATHAKLDPPPPEYTPIYCVGTTTAGNQCRRRPSNGSTYCETHAGASDTEYPERAREKKRAEEANRDEAARERAEEQERVAQPRAEAHVPTSSSAGTAMKNLGSKVLGGLILLAIIIVNLWLFLDMFQVPS